MKTVKGRIILRTQIVLISAIILATAINVWYLGTNMLTKSKAGLQAHSDYYATLINSNVEQDVGVVSGLKASVIANGFEAGQVKHIQQIVNTVYNNNRRLLGVYYAGNDGSFYTKSASGEVAPDYDPTARDWYRRAVGAGTTIIIAPYEDATTGFMCISVVSPVRVDGKLMGCVGVDIKLADVIETVDAIDYTEGAYGIIIDSERNIVTHPKEEFQPTGESKKNIISLLPELSGADLNGHEIVYAENQLGEGSYVAISTIEEPGWYMLTVISSDLVYGAMVRTVIIATILGLLIVLITAFLEFFILKKRLAPISSIIEASKQISEGNFDVELNIDKKDELGDLQRALAEMINNIESVISEQQGVLYEIASGNLAGANMGEYPGEFNEISESINSIKARLNDLIGDIQFSAINLQSTAIGFGYAIEPEEMRAVLKELSHEANDLMNKANMFKTKMS